MMVSLYFLIRNDIRYEDRRAFFWDYFFCLLFACLSMNANLVMINFVIMAILLFALKMGYIIRSTTRFSSYLLIYAALTLLSIYPLYVALSRLFFLKAKHELYFGSDTLSAAFNTLILSEGTYPDIFIQGIEIFVSTCFLINLFYIIRRYGGKTAMALISLMTFGLIAGLWMESMLFSAKYPHGRSALFFIPLFGLQLFFSAVHIYEYSAQGKRLMKAATAGMSIVMAFYFLSAANFKYTTTWRYDAHTKDAMHIVDNKTKNAALYYTISNDWLLEPSINYYIRLWDMKIYPTNRNGVTDNSDFIYQTEERPAFENYSLLKKYPDIGSSLLEKTGAATSSAHLVQHPITHYAKQ